MAVGTVAAAAADGAGQQVQQVITTPRHNSVVEAAVAAVTVVEASTGNQTMDHAVMHRRSTTKATNGAMNVVRIVTIPTDAGGGSPTSSHQQELLTGTSNHRKIHVRLLTTTH